MKQFLRFHEADRQIQIFRVFVMIIHDKYKWYAKVILFKNRYSCWFLNEFCGHCMVFMRSFCVILVRNLFAFVVSHFLSMKIYQNSTKILGMKYRHHKLWEMNKWHSENLKKISISFQHLTYCYEDKSFAIKWLKEDTNFAGPIHMSIMKETRWLPKKCPLQKNNEISATEMITTELYTS